MHAHQFAELITSKGFRQQIIARMHNPCHMPVVIKLSAFWFANRVSREDGIWKRAIGKQAFQKEPKLWL
jgi:hypothetical protein